MLQRSPRDYASSRCGRIPRSLAPCIQELNANGILKPLESHFRLCGSSFGSFRATQGVRQLRLSSGDPCLGVIQRYLEFLERRVRFVESRLGSIPRGVRSAKAIFSKVQLVDRALS